MMGCISVSELSRSREHFLWCIWQNARPGSNMKTHQMDPGWGLWNLQNKKHVIFKTIKGMKDGRTVERDERKKNQMGHSSRKCVSLDWFRTKNENETFCSKLGNLKGFYGLAVLCLCGRENSLVWEKHILECLRIRDITLPHLLLNDSDKEYWSWVSTHLEKERSTWKWPHFSEN